MIRRNQGGYAVLTVLLLAVALFMLMTLAMDLNYSLRLRNKEALKELRVKAERFNARSADLLGVEERRLSNGLTVFLSVNHAEPRIQTAIAVRTGGKDDPPDNTGLSHYLEHLMFKGSGRLGVSDHAKERPLLDKVENLFEEYRATTDTPRREALYQEIDKVSGEAAKLAVTNEYWKLLAHLGARGTNAFTSNDMTCYINDIPANALGPWLEIEADRFAHPVFRLFHTELETVYEEKNMYLDQDGRRASEALYAALFPTHPYGVPVVGKAEHLKNPSLKALKEYYRQRYVPGDMAIILAGDFDPDAAFALIERQFGGPVSKAASSTVPVVEAPLAKPVVKEVVGPDAESLSLAFRLPGANSADADLAVLTDMILSNGVAGLIDLNVNQAQRALGASCYADVMKDYSALVLSGRPKQGQTLEQLKGLLLSQLELVKKGEFPDWLLGAAVNDLRLKELRASERNVDRAYKLAGAFGLGTPWLDEAGRLDRLAKYRKQDVVDFVRRTCGDNYVVVYKRHGQAPPAAKLAKPPITPLPVNRDSDSELARQIKAETLPPVSPVFLDYSKDVRKSSSSLLYKHNPDNQLFTLCYHYDMGSNHDRKLPVALEYLNFLGCGGLSGAAFRQELYKNGVELSTSCSEDQCELRLSGLAGNLPRGVELLDSLLADAKPDEAALRRLVDDLLKRRADAKLSKQSILWNALYNYAVYGAKSPFTNILSERELKALKPDELFQTVRQLPFYPRTVLFYGPQSPADLAALLKAPGKQLPLPPETKFPECAVDADEVLVLDYPMTQVELVTLSPASTFDPALYPAIGLFNKYFSDIVFQELREARSLAYRAGAGIAQPSRPDRHNYLTAYVGTQADKLPEALGAMEGLLDKMPESDKSFATAKQSVLRKIAAERVLRSDALFNYLAAKKLGLDHDIRQDVFAQVPKLSFADLAAFHQRQVGSKKRVLLVVGDKRKLDLDALRKHGEIRFVTLEEIFGY